MKYLYKVKKMDLVRIESVKVEGRGGLVIDEQSPLIDKGERRRPVRLGAHKGRHLERMADELFLVALLLRAHRKAISPENNNWR